MYDNESKDSFWELVEFLSTPMSHTGKTIILLLLFFFSCILMYNNDQNDRKKAWKTRSEGHQRRIIVDAQKLSLDSDLADFETLLTGKAVDRITPTIWMRKGILFGGKFERYDILVASEMPLKSTWTDMLLVPTSTATKKTSTPEPKKQEIREEESTQNPRTSFVISKPTFCLVVGSNKHRSTRIFCHNGWRTEEFRRTTAIRNWNYSSRLCRIPTSKHDTAWPSLQHVFHCDLPKVLSQRILHGGGSLWAPLATRQGPFFVTNSIC